MRYQLIRTDAHGDTIDKLVDGLNERPTLHLASVVAAHFIAPASDVEVRGHLCVRVEALPAIGKEPRDEFPKHLPHEQCHLSVGIVVELHVALVHEVLDREATALEVVRNIVSLPVEIAVCLLDKVIRLRPCEAYDWYDDTGNECGASGRIQ